MESNDPTMIPLAHHNAMMAALVEKATHIMPRYFAVYSRTGVHIGVWEDGFTASQVLAEYPGGRIIETVEVSEIAALTPADARAALDEAISRARKDGWKACIAHLMQGGSQTGCDFHNEAGQVTGRFHGFFPAGATHDERAAHYEDLAAMERASKDAKPLDFGDLKWVDAALAPVEGAKA